ncbi:MAG: NAD(P)-dependent alcohol dehydrogenase [Acidobacteriota bacterium]|nr:NAD(P)-dependent alcohol dehydrogenase [Acidobacteriota bacterium]MDE3264631.1 NAD(P)-dependent alcohol dehydrogenase [Acidobacteriota bacterium]
MKAMVQDRYGSADSLKLRDIDKPAAGEGQVRLRVHAASWNAMDWHKTTGLPYLLRLVVGLTRPRDRVRGQDVAGEVDSVGKNAERFQPGDLVFGACNGAFAEYACAKEENLATMPGNVSFEKAAAVPVAGLTALQALRDHGRLQRGQHVLVVGASGGVGSFAVQIAKALEAQVTAACSRGCMDMVRSMGADHVIDSTQDDPGSIEPRFDLIVDMRATWSLATCRRLLRPGGTYVLVGGQRDGRWLGPVTPTLKLALSKPFVRQRLRGFTARVVCEDLSLLAEMMAAGKLSPPIDRAFRLHEVPEAMQYWARSHLKGKVVVTI